VTVFVDDAIRGDLTPVCVQTGAPATTIVSTDGWVGRGLGLLWLLVLAGPIGWLVLLVIAFGHAGQEKLVVKLPYSEAVLPKRNRLGAVRGAGLALTFVGVVGFVVGVLGLGWIWVGLAVVSLVVSLVAHARLNWDSVEVNLDGSRRWVQLAYVHPAFADAVQRSLPADHVLPAS